MEHYVTIASCQLNQWALDFEGNRDRIIESIKQAKEQKARLRLGPELEITGYGCEDHFLESDTYTHSWEMLCWIIKHPDCQNILLDIGMPVMHKSVRHNCRILALDGKIILIRPKLWLCDDGNFRESRWFTPWLRPRVVETYYLPTFVGDSLSQTQVPIGDAILQCKDTVVGIETCEELFTPSSPHVDMALDGVEIFLNASGSHHELRKLSTRYGLIQNSTQKCGGIYLYSNQRGCDGGRLYYDGCAMILSNGALLAQGSQFCLRDVEVISATVDVDTVRSSRFQPSHGLQGVTRPSYERIYLDFSLSSFKQNFDMHNKPTDGQPIRLVSPQEEIAYGPACWLWDYLRRSRSGGFFLPLSGGLDSASSAVIVHSMCRIVTSAIKDNDQTVLADVRRIVGDPNYSSTCPKELASHIFYTSFMGSENSSKETRGRAKELASRIGSYHVDMSIDTMTRAIVSLFAMVTGKTPQFRSRGGSQAENLALQNIQARSRMLLAYLFAQLLPWVRGYSGSLLVLGSSNVDESLRGYMTKYDCSSADVNPIGGVSKTDLKSFLEYTKDAFDMPILQDFLDATPTAELEPTTENYVQSDEVDMGMTYPELSMFGRLRKIAKCGPFSMFNELIHKWGDHLSPTEIASKVKRFFYYYGINRHKVTTLTPSYHAETYGVDDNRYDLRQFLYPSWTWQNKRIDEVAAKYEEHERRNKDQ
ncbi:glutamine-dependent NAD synthetase [Schizosaccharomyces cryophilus OY26]|uniref:Glutamine-dependent NAD(+) synthetase n=1 Tax=Schizosaccharomyces cryophilus (strain OY26 / ATCC MYA-4695 / CBS 11777 / NBRC 106824 / NRRL Y48691) TaxID=653667 RepID=S9VPX9_SCHCR|nr:glutamine-dependent NAD synthetase [Schizosaccharomyces cryophilus OY26]EPY50013.1 glutamine-dependent NAD synthetase [Schizosaccharomyces cryophilus OY26]